MSGDTCPSCEGTLTYLVTGTIRCAFCGTPIRDIHEEEKARTESFSLLSPSETLPPDDQPDPFLEYLKTTFPRSWCYGVTRVQGGVLKAVTFYGSTDRRLPGEVLVVFEGAKTQKEARNKSQALLKKALADAQRQEQKLSLKTYEGLVARHYDRVSEHWVIILEVRKKIALALFFTSTPNWSTVSRLAQPEEIAVTGFRSRTRTYLAPVLRPLRDFSLLDRKIPDHRIVDLQREFPWHRASSR